MADRAFHLEMQQAREQPRSRANVRPSRDITASAALHQLDLSREPRILFGRIVDCVAYCRFYKVQLERGGTAIACCDAQTTSSQVLGASALNTYVPGTGVLVLWHPGANFGVILAAVPDWLFDPRSALSDMVGQGSGVGLRVDGVHGFPFSLQGQGGTIDWSAGRPLDALHAGEWGAMAETGLAIFLDQWLAYLRVDEETGFFAFYHDQLARFAGHNLQQWSAGRHRSEEDDESEWDGEDGWTPYLWEARGVLGLGGTCSRDLTAQESQQDTPWYAALEPTADDQIPFHRAVDFRGYLGQGGRRGLCVPPAGLGASDLHTLAASQIIPGVFEQVVSLDGALGIRSAKSLIIGKDPFIARPKRRKRADDTTGDNSSNYKAGGVYGTGPAHIVQDLPNPGTANDQTVRASAVMDLYAHLFNWKSPHPFHYHTLDWDLPEEEELPAAAARDGQQPNYANLAGGQYLPAPTPFTLGVDPRYGNVMYFPNRAFLAFLDDGGIVLVDGWGSELRMTGGSIFLSCPGDVWSLPGKNHNVWAGFDAVVRANNSVHVSANQGDVHIKAESNFLALAGNNGCGGFLFDCRADHPVYIHDAHDPILAGFTVRCPTSTVVLMGQDMLLSTDAFAQPGGDKPSHLILDAGASKIITRSSYFERNLSQAALDFFTTTTTANEFWGHSSQLGADLAVNGQLAVATSIRTANSTDVAAMTARATALAGYAPSSLSDMTELASRTDLTTVQFVWPAALGYQTTGLILAEPRWQQMARQSGVVLPFWQENPAVDASASATYPHPGAEAWTAGAGYQQQNLNLFNDTTGAAVDRGSAYETAAYATPSAVNFDNNYPVIIAFS